MSYFVKAKDVAECVDLEFLFITEGSPEVGLVCSYLNHIDFDFRRAKVVCYEGNSKLSLFTKTLVKDCESLPSLRSIGVIADSENNPQGRLAAFIQMGEKLGYEGCSRAISSEGRFVLDGKKFAVSLSPSNSSPGRVEKLILSEMHGSSAHNCFSDSFRCSELFGAGGMSEKGRVAVLSAALLDDFETGRSGARHAFEARKFDVMAAPYAIHRAAIDFLLE